MRHLAIVCALLPACQCSSPVSESDGGDTTPLEMDAGAVDASLVDAGVSDAGVGDAGPIDAGTPIDDGGTTPLDGGAWWYRFRNPPSYLMLTATAVDPAGNVYVAGRSEQGALLGATPTGSGTMFITKFSADGQVLWAIRFGEGGGAQVRDMVIAPDGSIAVTGNTHGPPFPALVIGAVRLPTQGGSDTFVASFGADGTLRWAALRGGPLFDRSTAIGVTATGQIVVAIQLGYTVQLLRYSSTGAVELDAQVATNVSINASDLSTVSSLALDDQGNVYLSIQGAAGANVTGTPTSAHRFEDGFVASYTPTGTRRWARQLRTNLGISVTGTGLDMRTIVFDRTEVAVIGHFFHEVDFGAGVVDGGGRAFFLARYDPATGALKKVSVVSDLAFNGYDLRKSHDGRVVLTANWRGNPLFDQQPLPTADAAALVFLDGMLERVRVLNELDHPPTFSPVTLAPGGRLIFPMKHLQPDTLRLTHFSDLALYDTLIVSLPP